MFQYFSFSFCVTRFGSHASPLFPCELVWVCAIGPTDKEVPLLGCGWRFVMYIWCVASTGCWETACSCTECGKWPVSVLWWLCTSAWLWHFAVLKWPVSSQCLSAGLWHSAAHGCAVNVQVPSYNTSDQLMSEWLATVMHSADCTKLVGMWMRSMVFCKEKVWCCVSRKYGVL
jgi:hypothetical protein